MTRISSRLAAAFLAAAIITPAAALADDSKAPADPNYISDMCDYCGDFRTNADKAITTAYIPLVGYSTTRTTEAPKREEMPLARAGMFIRR